jgi:hypothetical protein
MAKLPEEFLGAFAKATVFKHCRVLGKSSQHLPFGPRSATTEAHQQCVDSM